MLFYNISFYEAVGRYVTGNYVGYIFDESVRDIEKGRDHYEI
jgi:hypothetical protein